MATVADMLDEIGAPIPESVPAAVAEKSTTPMASASNVHTKS